jgi:hypothetical protein
MIKNVAIGMEPKYKQRVALCQWATLSSLGSRRRESISFNLITLPIRTLANSFSCGGDFPQIFVLIKKHIFFKYLILA